VNKEPRVGAAIQLTEQHMVKVISMIKIAEQPNLFDRHLAKKQLKSSSYSQAIEEDVHFLDHIGVSD
jgi:hypothetical protein